MEKPTAAALELFEQAFPKDARAERKKMFGMPAGFTNGYMFFGVFENGVIFRLGEAQSQAVLGQAGLKPFTPMEGRVWADYVEADATVWRGKPEVAKWAQAALEHTQSLPPKEKKAAKAKAAPKAKPKR
jgi:TfoX/Sxy family transcriptional regulator of competence genes